MLAVKVKLAAFWEFRQTGIHTRSLPQAVVEVTFVKGCIAQDERASSCRFAEPPWDRRTPRWQEIDRTLSADHLARQMKEAVEELDLKELQETYAGRGSKAHPPRLLLAFVLFERQRGRQSPAQWHRDAQECEPAQWLLFGLKPGRAVWYEFRKRLEGQWDGLHTQVMQQARALGVPVGERVAVDGSLVAALASRRRLANQKTLTNRIESLRQAVATDERQALLEARSYWMAKHSRTRARQLESYLAAQCRMDQSQAENRRRPSSKRRKPEKIVVSVSEPEATLGRDKLQVFRPLYNVQLMYDLDSSFISAYETFSCQNDPGTIGTLLERSRKLAGKTPSVALGDSSYAGGPDVALCEQAGVTLYAPVSENDYSEANRKKRKACQIPKKEFTWLPDQQTYRCPEGHWLIPGKTTPLARSNDRTTLQSTYRCPPEHCMKCPRQAACTPSPQRGRSVSRLEHEDLLDVLRARMDDPEAKALYKLRAQTVELRYADLKQHRNMTRFHGYGLQGARGEVAGVVLAYNLLILQRHRKLRSLPFKSMQIPEETPV